MVAYSFNPSTPEAKKQAALPEVETRLVHIASSRTAMAA